MDAMQVVAELNEMATRMDRLDFREPLITLRQWAIFDIADSFAQRESPDGAPWAPLAGKYPPNKRPLIDTGAMLGASLGRNAGTAAAVESNAQEVGVKGDEIFYAIFHQLGTSKMPARPFIGMREETIDDGAEWLADYVLRRIFG